MLYVEFIAEILTTIALAWYVIMMFDFDITARREKIFMAIDPPLIREKDPVRFDEIHHAHRLGIACLGIGILIMVMMIFHDFRLIRFIALA